ncbi:MAG TPA: multicopper oxidase domain-containing protein [Candidatus Eisenbacteria bacterium]|nr:multicopper oxidase domain-containing protein [Candidatus Eisenbacteria bacterium]
MADIRCPLRPLRRSLPALVAITLVTFGCSRGQRAGGGQQMVYGGPPATVDTVRHAGPYASGSALSFDPVIKPLDPAPVKTIQLDVVDRVIEVAPGVQFLAWTFGGQVPGPTVRARVGDRIRFSMTNRSDEPVPGGVKLQMPMMHSMDFHAAMVSPTDKYRSIPPGRTISFEFTLNYPGVFMYHCGTPMILEHIASGMYGMVVVEPREGYPTHCDREYTIIQSEIYARLDPDQRRVNGAPLYVLDSGRVRTKESTYTVFNGRYNGMVDHPLVAKPGERVRLFLLNVGPSNTSSFHIVGEILDRVYLDGNPANILHGMQTVLLGSSSSAILEFQVPEAGKYVMVDHHFANASQGAIGVIDATGGTPEPGSLEHHNIPAVQATPADPATQQGKLQFESKCLACHTLGQGPKIGPDLKLVAQRRNDVWITHWLTSPEHMLATDDTAKALLARFTIPMPNQNLSPDEIKRLISYFHWVRATGAPQAPDTLKAKR